MLAASSTGIYQLWCEVGPKVWHNKLCWRGAFDHFAAPVPLSWTCRKEYIQWNTEGRAHICLYIDVIIVYICIYIYMIIYVCSGHLSTGKFLILSLLGSGYMMEPWRYAAHHVLCLYRQASRYIEEASRTSGELSETCVYDVPIPFGTILWLVCTVSAIWDIYIILYIYIYQLFFMFFLFCAFICASMCLGFWIYSWSLAQWLISTCAYNLGSRVACGAPVAQRTLCLEVFLG